MKILYKTWEDKKSDPVNPSGSTLTGNT